MANILAHLRRLILLMSIVYLSGALLRRLLHESCHSCLFHMNGRARWSKNLHVQRWAYIYASYVYFLMVNCINIRRITNMLEFFLT